VAAARQRLRAVDRHPRRHRVDPHDRSRRRRSGAAGGDRHGHRISSLELATSAPVAAVGAPPPPPLTKAPANTVLPVISGTPRTTRTLTSSTGTWTGTTPITWAYQWQRASNAGATWSSISGATARAFGVRTSDRNYVIRVRVTATNQVGSAPVFSKPVGPITAGGLLGLF
jgi:hypothetical protein